MTDTEPTLRDYLEESDEHDVSELDEIPEPVRERINDKLGGLAE